MQPLLPKELDEYCLRHSESQPSILAELEKETRESMADAQMLSGPVEGRLLALLVALTQAKSIVEIGTFTGYSALWMAMAMPEEGKIHTIDRDQQAQAVARRYIEKSGMSERIHLCHGDAADWLNALPGPWDLVFLDADKERYPSYYSAIVPKLRPGGILVVDNCLWSGEVLHPESASARAIDLMNKQLTEDDDMENVLLPVRDGIQVARKRDRSTHR